MKSYFELHITIEEPKERAKLVEAAIDGYPHFTWKFSAITDDIILGEGNKFYATTHGSYDWGTQDCEYALKDMAKHLQDAGLNVIRKKIEHVIYDSIKGRDF